MSSQNRFEPIYDRTEWDQAWAGAPHRRLNELTKFDWSGLTDFDLGGIVDATFVEVPNQYLGRGFIATEVCPFCGEQVRDTNGRVEVALSPIFERPPNLGFGGWMHRDCIDQCPRIDEPNPIPW